MRIVEIIQREGEMLVTIGFDREEVETAIGNGFYPFRNPEMTLRQIFLLLIEKARRR